MIQRNPFLGFGETETETQKFRSKPKPARVQRLLIGRQFERREHVFNSRNPADEGFEGCSAGYQKKTAHRVYEMNDS